MKGLNTRPDVTPAADWPLVAGGGIHGLIHPANSTTSHSRPSRRRPLETPSDLPASKRTRIQLPRAVKRKLSPPSLEEQKRARLEVIACVSCISLLC
jgi:hypothetical protein